jgi:hypothetical protein
MTHASRKQVVPRRAFLKTAAAGAALSSLAGRGWGAPAENAGKSDSERAITALYRSLTPEQRAAVSFDWDFRVDIKYGRKPLWRPDPQGVRLRTHVSNAWRITPQLIGSEFYTDEQRELILDVLRTTVAPDWIDKLKQQARDDSGVAWGGDQALAIFGEPGSGPCQCVITGFHLTVRATTQSNPQAAFGGAITHGHQPSGFYEKFNHPGNFFWKQGLLANEVYKLFDAQQQRQALVTENLPIFQYLGEVDRSVIVPDTPWDAPRREQDIRFRRSGDPLLGLPIARFGSEQRSALDAVLASLLEPYRQEYQDQVFDCLKQQGGLQACSLAFYQERDMGNDGIWDNWRLEGPALTWFFRGSPHVHIWIHVAQDPKAPVTSYFG